MTEITPHNILRHELIGLTVKIARSTDPKMRLVSGKVVDETRNMLAVSQRGRQILVPKSISSFKFKLDNGTIVEVDGTRLVARPENRLKTRVRRW